jgi:hypothetical protein
MKSLYSNEVNYITTGTQFDKNKNNCQYKQGQTNINIIHINTRMVQKSCNAMQIKLTKLKYD